MADGKWPMAAVTCVSHHIENGALRINCAVSNGGRMGNFQDLRVWQQSMILAEWMYSITKRFPDDERFGMVSQMRRAAVSVASNIAEGKGHRSDKEFLHFLFHARGSLYELQTQVLLANKIKYVTDEQLKEAMDNITGVASSLTGLINSLSGDSGHRPSAIDHRQN
jgi:four helix bundle protein